MSIGRPEEYLRRNFLTRFISNPPRSRLRNGMNWFKHFPVTLPNFFLLRWATGIRLREIPTMTAGLLFGCTTLNLNAFSTLDISRKTRFSRPSSIDYAMDILDECDLTIVIPCFNEARRLPRTLARTITYLATKPGKHEIIVVSDGSTDGTVEETEKAYRTLPDNVRGKWFGYTPNGGKGKAVKVGVSQATGNRILFMDADYAVPLEDLARGEALLDSGFDIAIGSRTAHDTKIVEHQSFLRERIAKLFGFIQRNYLGLRLKD